MSLSRRRFLQLAGASVAAATLPACARPLQGRTPDFARLYDRPAYGDLTLLHLTDCHAQLLPVYFREPNINIGVGIMKNRPPHLVGDAFLHHFGMPPRTRDAYAFTYLDFVEAARTYGKLGGFAQLATLVKHLRSRRPGGTLLLDGGDTWQGSATALWTRGQDMVGAQQLLGVDLMTGHWDFTYGADRIKDIINTDFKKHHIEFIAQNVTDNTWGDLVFTPFVIRELNKVPVAVIGQAFPYTPIANPAYFVPEWQFGINEKHMQKMVDQARAKGAQVVVVLSHNGMDVDLKMASRVTGIDFILGGHTHDAVPTPSVVRNPGGHTSVISSGSHGKFLGVLDIKMRGRKIAGHRFSLLPVFSEAIPEDPEMAAHIRAVRAPFTDQLNQQLATTGDLLYRRGNFNGTFDQAIVEAMMAVQDAPIAFSPGFRWGTSLLPGSPIRMEDLMNQTAITYPTATVTTYTGRQIKNVMEDIADNLFNKDPYYQQGGDMVRTGGLTYTMAPARNIGHRISDLRLADGRPIRPQAKYKVAGWASVQKTAPGRPIWEVVAEYLRDRKTVDIKAPYVPRLKGMTGNEGYEAT
ncbi:MAG: thiosulfohydrolase SoxB [Acidiferrobacteraceae bacterium]